MLENVAQEYAAEQALLLFGRRPRCPRHLPCVCRVGGQPGPAARQGVLPTATSRQLPRAVWNPHRLSRRDDRTKRSDRALLGGSPISARSRRSSSCSRARSAARSSRRCMRRGPSTMRHTAAWRDVLYATTTSGRSAPIPHSERIVGLVLNTLPVRIRLDARQHEDDDELLQRTNTARAKLLLEQLFSIGVTLPNPGPDPSRATPPRRVHAQLLESLEYELPAHRSAARLGATWAA